MSKHDLILLIVLGAAAIAVWVDVRYPRLVPERAERRFAHAGAAFLGAQLLVPVTIQALLGVADSMPVQLVALFALFLPALVYAFLTGIWLLRLLRNVLPG
jgi:hypothetical protein